MDRNLTMIVAVLLLSACAELPKCPSVNAYPFQYQGTQWFLIDAENLQAFWTRSEKLAKGECE